MKLSEIRPCDKCGGKIAPQFYVIRTSLALFKPHAVNQVMGMTQFFQGSLALAEVFSSDDNPVVVAMDDPDGKVLMDEIFICQHCYLHGPIDLAVLIESRRAKLDDEQQNDDDG